MTENNEQICIGDMNSQSDEKSKKSAEAKHIENSIHQAMGEISYKHFITVVDTASYIAVKAKNYNAAQIYIRKAYVRIEVANKYVKLFDENALQYEVKKDTAVIKVGSIDDVVSLGYALSQIAVAALAEYGGESFGCCGRYVECSDAMKCIHPDKVYAMACAYRKNLENGRIFYGKNKNI